MTFRRQAMRTSIDVRTTRRIPAGELQEGDWPVSLAGWRPCSRVRRHRGGTVSFTADGTRYKDVPGERVILVRLGAHRNPDARLEG